MCNDEFQQEIDIVFLDGETRRTAGMTFSICCVKAAYQRVTEGACSHKQLAVNEKACQLVLAPALGLARRRYGSLTCDYTGTPPFADAEWKDDPAMCQWCAGTGHPHGDESYGMCKCPDLPPNVELRGCALLRSPARM